MVDEQPQDAEDGSSSDENLEDDLDKVLAEASSLVETLTDEVGTPEEPEPEPPAEESSSDSPDFMDELTQDAPPPPSPGPPGDKAGGGSGSGGLSGGKPGIVTSGKLGVVGTQITAEEDDALTSLEEEPDTTDAFVEEDKEVAQESSRVRRWLGSQPGNVALVVLMPVVGLLELIDRPIQGLSQPIRFAMGVLAIATLSTSVIALFLSLW